MTQTEMALQLAREAEEVETELSGHLLLGEPLLNKGSAFTEAERHDLGLLGLLPYHLSTMEEQLARTWENYCRLSTPLEKYIFLTSLQDRNEVLFYRLVGTHITEMMPIIYTPTVGLGCQIYSHIFRRPRGLYISYPYRREIDLLLKNSPLESVEVIVVTDGERILGLGDQGVGGMGIPVGKLSLYTLCAGIHPRTTLPIVLDVGTDNRQLLDDPLYLGWRQARVRGEGYDEFIEEFVQAVERRFPGVLLQWEDFSKFNAPKLLKRYRERICSFNDDIQGTGAVALAGMLAASKRLGQRLRDQRIVIFGAGASASGIAEQAVTAMVAEGATEAEGRAAIRLIDSHGLVHDGRSDLDGFKRRFACPSGELDGWRVDEAGRYGLWEVVSRIRPTVLIGASAQTGAFTEPVVREMARHVEHPVIFPLSNPTSKSEANPADLFRWTDGRVLTATGSPCPEVAHAGRQVRIGQCNNAFIFPGVGLGVVSSGARRVTNAMFVAAARVLSGFSPALTTPDQPLYPPLTRVREVSRAVAIAVAREAVSGGLADPLTDEEIIRRIEAKMWVPHYGAIRFTGPNGAEWVI